MKTLNIITFLNIYLTAVTGFASDRLTYIELDHQGIQSVNIRGLSDCELEGKELIKKIKLEILLANGQKIVSTFKNTKTYTDVDFESENNETQKDYNERIRQLISKDCKELQSAVLSNASFTTEGGLILKLTDHFKKYTDIKLGVLTVTENEHRVKCTKEYARVWINKNLEIMKQEFDVETTPCKVGVSNNATQNKIINDKNNKINLDDKKTVIIEN